MIFEYSMRTLAFEVRVEAFSCIHDVFRVFDWFVCSSLLADFEASFLRLMDKLTNGTAIFVNDTGNIQFTAG